MAVLTIYVHHDFKLRLNQRFNWPKMMKKSCKKPIFPPADPEGPKDLDLDPGPKIDWSILPLYRQGLWEIGMWCCMTSITPVNILLQMTLEVIWLQIWNQQPWLPWYPCAYCFQWPPRPWWPLRPWWPPNDLGGHMTSDLTSATLITLVSMCILPPTASEAMAASKQPRRSHLTSKFNSVTSVTYVSMSLWLPKASMS